MTTFIEDADTGKKLAQENVLRSFKNLRQVNFSIVLRSRCAMPDPDLRCGATSMGVGQEGRRFGPPYTPNTPPALTNRIVVPEHGVEVVRHFPTNRVASSFACSALRNAMSGSDLVNDQTRLGPRVSTSCINTSQPTILAPGAMRCEIKDARPQSPPKMQFLFTDMELVAPCI
eukprot:3322466-Rhodomonas_salina.4